MEVGVILTLLYWWLSKPCIPCSNFKCFCQMCPCDIFIWKRSV